LEYNRHGLLSSNRLDPEQLSVSNIAMWLNISIIILAYLLGSIASAILVCKTMGLGDPRNSGSGNPGATNVLRLYGKPAAILTLAGDVLKGVIPVLLARALGTPDIIIALTGLAAFMGHLFPIFFGFHGGKGVATLIGVLIATHWMLGLTYIGTWLIAALLFRYSSLAALIAAVLTPLYTSQILSDNNYIYTTSTMCLILIWRHRSNIKNLIEGKEDKIGQND